MSTFKSPGNNPLQNYSQPQTEGEQFPSAPFKPSTPTIFVNANLTGLQGGGPFFVNPLG